jgi:exonuclease VII small subunit
VNLEEALKEIERREELIRGSDADAVALRARVAELEALKLVSSERDGARAEAAAAKRERDVARLALEESNAKWSRAVDLAVGLEREACAILAVTEIVGLGFDEDDACVVRDAIRARGGK